MDRKYEQEPVEARDTLRHRILQALANGPLTGRELSGLVGIPEKDVYDHLEHIRATLRSAGSRLRIEPAECMHCGFQFGKRERLRKPGKCPVCRAGPVHPPRFSIAR